MKMREIISILKALCGDNRALFNEVSEEIKEAITYEEHNGIRIANTAGVIRLAMQLECSQYPSSLKRCDKPERINLADIVQNPELKRLLGQPGIDGRSI